jgi:hypothetical protein
LIVALPITCHNDALQNQVPLGGGEIKEAIGFAGLGTGLGLFIVSRTLPEEELLNIFLV